MAAFSEWIERIAHCEQTLFRVTFEAGDSLCLPVFEAKRPVDQRQYAKESVQTSLSFASGRFSAIALTDR